MPLYEQDKMTKIAKKEDERFSLNVFRQTTFFLCFPFFEWSNGCVEAWMNGTDG